MKYLDSVIRQEKKNTAVTHRCDCLHRKSYELYKNIGRINAARLQESRSINKMQSYFYMLVVHNWKVKLKKNTLSICGITKIY